MWVVRRDQSREKTATTSRAVLSMGMRSAVRWDGCVRACVGGGQAWNGEWRRRPFGLRQPPMTNASHVSTYRIPSTRARPPGYRRSTMSVAWGLALDLLVVVWDGRRVREEEEAKDEASRGLHVSRARSSNTDIQTHSFSHYTAHRGSWGRHAA